MSLTQQAHHAILSHLATTGRQQLRFSIDATCGNGYDTAFLVQHTEHLTFGFDIQAQAIAKTRQRLTDSEQTDGTGVPYREKVYLFQQSHTNMLAACQQQQTSCVGQVDAIMFNLGYLPRADKNITTNADSTLSALNAALQLLSTQGIMTILCYRGHAGGLRETDAVLQWLGKKTQLTYHVIDSNKANATTPFLLTIKYSTQTHSKSC